MTYRSLIVGSGAILSWVFAVNAQTGGTQQTAPQPRTPQSQPAVPAPVRPASTTAAAASTVTTRPAADVLHAELRGVPQRAHGGRRA